MNFFILLILIVEVFVECNSPCQTKDENITAVIQIIWKKDYFYEYEEIGYRPLVTVLNYFIEKTILVNIVDEDFPNLQCDVETMCTTTKPNIVKQVEKNNYRSFCELFFDYEHKKEYVFTINDLKLTLFSIQNFTIYSNQHFNKYGIKLFNIR